MSAPRWRDDRPIRVGVATCLLGQPVRWDGGHKRDAFLVDQLGPFVEWVPVCPELEIGLGVPRETIHLARRDGRVRLVAGGSGADLSERMAEFARRRVRELERLELSGYVLKEGSPSCGFERVPVRNEKGTPERNGRGAFASVLVASSPLLPIEDERRLGDPRLRENWIERVFAYRRLRSLFASRWSVAGLLRFHTAHKLQLLAHGPTQCAELERLVSEGRAAARSELRERYAAGFMNALRAIATPRRHVNVLQHVLGHFRRHLDAADRRELAARIEHYGRGRVPLSVPIALVRQHVARLDLPYLAGQVYLHPHPSERMVRNCVQDRLKGADRGA